MTTGLVPNDSDLYKYFPGVYDDLGISNLFKGYYDYFYSNGYDYDISGFSLIYFLPPHLSGFNNEFSLDPISQLREHFKNFVTLSLEFNVSDIEVEKSTIGLIGNESYNYPTNVTSSPEVSISYLDTSDLFLYKFHSVWVRYIHAVTLGNIPPAQNYIDNNTIDYLASIYFIKFDSDMKTPLMISKATGVYPNFVPFKEIVGNRATNQITICNCSYTSYYFYEEPIDISTYDTNPYKYGSKLYNEFKTIFEGLYARV